MHVPASVNCFVQRGGWFPVLLLVARIPLFSQLTGYPSNGYPGQLPGVRISVPHRGKLQRAAGALIKLDQKTIVVGADDGRLLEYKRTAKTKFLRDSRKMEPSVLKAGDRIAVEAIDDEQSYLHARNVYFGAPEGVAIPAASRGTFDPVRPTLKHGAPPPRETPEPDGDASRDPVIDKARAALEAFTENLPNYVCTELMTRYWSNTDPVDWRPLDAVSAGIVFLDGKESYRNVSIDGKPFRKGMEELSGSWSTGEFVTILRALFTATDGFRLRGQSSLAGVTVREYSYRVERERSTWRLQMPSQSLNPSYEGSVWIDPASGRVLRVEMQARALPQGFSLDTAESAVDYENVSIGASSFLLPAHAETLFCKRGTSSCTRNKIGFRDYHKFAAESSVTFAQQ